MSIHRMSAKILMLSVAMVSCSKTTPQPDQRELLKKPELAQTDARDQIGGFAVGNSGGTCTPIGPIIVGLSLTETVISSNSSSMEVGVKSIGGIPLPVFGSVKVSVEGTTTETITGTYTAPNNCSAIIESHCGRLPANVAYTVQLKCETVLDFSNLVSGGVSVGPVTGGLSHKGSNKYGASGTATVSGTIKEACSIHEWQGAIINDIKEKMAREGTQSPCEIADLAHKFGYAGIDMPNPNDCENDGQCSSEEHEGAVGRCLFSTSAGKKTCQPRYLENQGPCAGQSFSYPCDDGLNCRQDGPLQGTWPFQEPQSVCRSY
jgi:hypothetical protein